MAQKIKVKTEVKTKAKYEAEFKSVRDLLDIEFKDLFDRKPEVALLAQIAKNTKGKG